MKLFKLALLAIGSAAVSVAHADAARPSYGGTLRVQEAGTISTPDPAAEPADEAERAARAHVLPLVFETVVAIDPSGGLRPLLATAWDCDEPCTRWRFHLRRGVILHDGATLEPWHVASALRRANAAWTVTSDRDDVFVQTPRSTPELPWELSDPRYGVAVRSRDGGWLGTGPFRISRFDASHLSLRAHEQYWNSRAFLDGIDVDMGIAAGDRLTSLELGRADVVPIRQIDVRRVSQLGVRTAATGPLDLFAVIFEPHRADAADDRLRRAFAAAINRSVLSDALLQGYATPAWAVLPPWLSGYDLPHAAAADRPISASLPIAQRRVILRIAPGDPLAQAIADRLAVDAREAGIAVTVQAPTGLAPRPDARLVRVKVTATSPDRALAAVVSALGARAVARATADEPPPIGAPIDALYRFERALLERDIIVPVVHLADAYGIGDGVQSRERTIIQPTGAWDLANVWLDREHTGSR